MGKRMQPFCAPGSRCEDSHRTICATRDSAYWQGFEDSPTLLCGNGDTQHLLIKYLAPALKIHKAVGPQKHLAQQKWVQGLPLKPSVYTPFGIFHTGRELEMLEVRALAIALQKPLETQISFGWGREHISRLFHTHPVLPVSVLSSYSFLIHTCSLSHTFFQPLPSPADRGLWPPSSPGSPRQAVFQEWPSISQGFPDCCPATPTGTSNQRPLLRPLMEGCQASERHCSPHLPSSWLVFPAGGGGQRQGCGQLWKRFHSWNKVT